MKYQRRWVINYCDRPPARCSSVSATLHSDDMKLDQASTIVGRLVVFAHLWWPAVAKLQAASVPVAQAAALWDRQTDGQTDVPWIKRFIFVGASELLFSTVPVTIIMPNRPTGHFGIAQSARPSVCLSHSAAAWATDTLAACSLATASHQKCADCGPVRGRT